jgi:tetratricopeptide (TPR) repeat protein
MRKVLVTFVLALTTAALAQGTSPTQQPSAQQPAQQPSAQQPGAADQANTPTSQKVIKDPAEYNAYMTALNTTDAAARGAGMEAFLNQYPNSIVKLEALEQARSAYQQSGNQAKTEELAQKTLQVDPNNLPALAIVVYMEGARVKDVAGGAKARADAERGLQELPNFKKPEGTSDADFEKMRTQMANIFSGTAAYGALQQKDYAAAQKYYEQALKLDPNDLANNYRMAIALLESNPLNPLGFWYGAKAIGVAQSQTPPNTAAVQSMAPYVTSRYKKYHGNTDDWNQRVATAASQTAPPANFVAGIPLAPTECDLAAQAVPATGDIDLSFSDRELVLSCRDKTPANKAAAERVWQDIQTKQKNGEAKLKIPVKIIAVPDESSLQVALGEDNQAANKPDMKITMEKPMTKPPAVGSNIEIIGVISDYAPDPFMFTMTKGELPAAKTPAKPAPKKTTKKTATKKSR